MAQKFIQSSEFNFNVEAAPSFMQLPNGSFVKDGFTVNRRTDTMQVLGKVTDRYGIVQNADLIGAAEDAFKNQGLADYSRKVIVSGQGERMYAVYTFRNRTKALKVGDEVGLRLTVQNSFDGSLRASLMAGIMRLVCKNGAVMIEREVGMTKKHGSQITLEFAIEAVKRTVANWEKSITFFDRLADVQITQVQGDNILHRLEDSNILSGKLREGVAGIWANPTHREDRGRNLWNLYNAVTQHLTHNVESERFELADRVSHNVLAAFDRASRDANKLAKFAAPIQEKELALN